eukprot:8387595-Pyramimonas_sp.AAC.1
MAFQRCKSRASSSSGALRAAARGRLASVARASRIGTVLGAGPSDDSSNERGPVREWRAGIVCV